MKTVRLNYFIFVLIVFFSCSTSDEVISSEPSASDALYFPSLNSNTWESTSASAIGWNTNELEPLLDFLENSNTKSFIMLYNGKIVTESYFNGADANSNNPWFSAGKTLTAFMTGIAQEEGFLDINTASSTYLGSNWSSLTTEQENAISVRNHITMTTGLNYNVDFACTDSECLTYLNDSGSNWYYHNAPYTLTLSIISGAINSDFDSYFNSRLRDKIGMQGTWVPFGYNKFYFSNARSMARFGLLCLNNGIWNDQVIMSDSNYFNTMTNTSQGLNPAYGYLWWLNGKSSYRLPSESSLFQGKLIPNAPDDLVAGLGANDQKLYVVPSKKLVIIRMGNSGD
ncbi:MAG: serine hydrolase [Winogradskyella sp.]|uniref:serine hydrolase domain-containing protein n=1 Tax=Winogradskyella sp. TaxID=1883156 RepID=UPI00181FFE0F|nr:serine hydrolase [Winogradskyella sp.]MBT8244095.1 serine hydrolase [Winogradskyella sp.]NNK23601.1 serine hydrolase [Winogradskyella sp.]